MEVDRGFPPQDLPLLLNMSLNKHIVWKRPFWSQGEMGSDNWYGLTSESRILLQSSAIQLVGEKICVTIGTRSCDVPGAADQEELR